MNHWDCLLDLADRPAPIRLAPCDGVAPAAARFDPIRRASLLVTDFDAAQVGVASMPFRSRDYGPLLEKRLRDDGVLDQLSQVIVHDVRRERDVARVFYTAVPVSTYLRYREWIDRSEDHAFLYPFAAALAAGARRFGLRDGLAIGVDARRLWMLVLREGAVVAADHFPLDPQAPDEARRAVRAIRATAEQSGEAAGEGTARQLRVWCAPGGEAAGFADALVQAIAPDGAPDGQPIAMPAGAVFDALPIRHAETGLLRKAAYAAERVVPYAAMAMLLIALVSAGWLWRWSGERDARASELETQRQRIERLQPAGLSVAAQAELASRERTAQLAQLLSLELRSRFTPDLRALLHDISRSLPSDLKVTEVGVVADETRALITVTGISGWSDMALRAERQFVEAIEQLGYTVARREFQSGSGRNAFRVALIWETS